jgi:hypothetical protein
VCVVPINRSGLRYSSDLDIFHDRQERVQLDGSGNPPEEARTLGPAADLTARSPLLQHAGQE